MAPHLSLSFTEPVVFLRSQYASGEDLRGRRRPVNVDNPPAQLRALCTLNLAKPSRIKRIEVQLKGVCRTDWPEGIGPNRVETHEETLIIKEKATLYNAAADDTFAAAARRAASVGPGHRRYDDDVDWQRIEGSRRSVDNSPSQDDDHRFDGSRRRSGFFGARASSMIPQTRTGRPSFADEPRPPLSRPTSRGVSPARSRVGASLDLHRSNSSDDHFDDPSRALPPRSSTSRPATPASGRVISAAASEFSIPSDDALERTAVQPASATPSTPEGAPFQRHSSDRSVLRHSSNPSTPSPWASPEPSRPGSCSNSRSQSRVDLRADRRNGATLHPLSPRYSPAAASAPGMPRTASGNSNFSAVPESVASPFTSSPMAESPSSFTDPSHPHHHYYSAQAASRHSGPASTCTSQADSTRGSNESAINDEGEDDDIDDDDDDEAGRQISARRRQMAFSTGNRHREVSCSDTIRSSSQVRDTSHARETSRNRFTVSGIFHKARAASRKPSGTLDHVHFSSEPASASAPGSPAPEDGRGRRPRTRSTLSKERSMDRPGSRVSTARRTGSRSALGSRASSPAASVDREREREREGGHRRGLKALLSALTGEEKLDSSEDSEVKHEWREFKKGTYTYPISLPVASSLPPTIHCDFGHVSYTLKVTVHRAGALTPNLTAEREVILVASPGEDDTEETENIVVERTWDDQMSYLIILNGKQFPIGTRIPMHIRLLPLAKVKVHRISAVLEEKVDYYAHQRKVTRHEAARRFQLLRCLNADETPLLPILSDSPTALQDSPLAALVPSSAGLNGEEDAVIGVRRASMSSPPGWAEPGSDAGPSLLDPTGPWELQHALQLPLCAAKVHHSSNHAKSNIAVHHILRVTIRVERGDDLYLDSKGKRKLWDVIVEAPIHILSCRCTTDWTSLPSYFSITSPSSAFPNPASSPYLSTSTSRCRCEVENPTAFHAAGIQRAMEEYVAGVGPRPSAAERRALGSGVISSPGPSLPFSQPVPVVPPGRGGAGAMGHPAAATSIPVLPPSFPLSSPSLSSTSHLHLHLHSHSHTTAASSDRLSESLTPAELSRRYEQLVSGEIDETGGRPPPPPSYRDVLEMEKEEEGRGRSRIARAVFAPQPVGASAGAGAGARMGTAMGSGVGEMAGSARVQDADRSSSRTPIAPHLFDGGHVDGARGPVDSMT